MDIQIQTTNLFEARKNKKLMRALYSLTFRGNSEMRNELNSVQSDEFAQKYKIIVASYQNRIVGWAMLFPTFWHMQENNIMTFYLYVARSHRRMHVGSRVLKHAKMFCNLTGKKLCCVPHDEISMNFFQKNNVLQKKVLMQS